VQLALGAPSAAQGDGRPLVDAAEGRRRVRQLCGADPDQGRPG